MGRPANTVEDFFTHIDTKGGDKSQCWPWTGKDIKDGRGYFSFRGKRWIVYRLMYVLVHGKDSLDSKTFVRHKCDNSLCCNPEHLEPGSQSDNEQDKYVRDRAGLPVAIVKEIKLLLERTSWSQQRIAEHVSGRTGTAVSRSAVRDIALGVRRARIDEAKTTEELYGVDENASEEE